MLLPIAMSALRGMLDQWFERIGVQPIIIGEFDDSALLKVFGQAGEGIFAAPTAIEKEIVDQYNVRLIGRTEQVIERFYAITVERRIKHPTVREISDAAHEGIFG